MAVDTILDQSNYNIFTDPELATRSEEFLSEYISGLASNDYSSLMNLDYATHSAQLNDNDYRAALLADTANYEGMGANDISLYGDSKYVTYLNIGDGQTTAIQRATNSEGHQWETGELYIQTGKGRGERANRKTIDIGLDNMKQIEQIVSKREAGWEAKVANILSPFMVKDKNTNKYIVPDNDLKKSYFAKAAEQAGGVKGLYDRGDATFRKQIETAIGDSTGYESFIGDVAKRGADIMGDQNQSILTDYNDMVTNTLDTKTWQGLLEDEEVFRGIY